ncbi:MAG: hypothetical protein WCH34_05945 [Bacteroidota bacterium]
MPKTNFTKSTFRAYCNTHGDVGPIRKTKLEADKDGENHTKIIGNDACDVETIETDKI